MPPIDSIDAALLAYMLDGAAPIYGRLKVQKTPFFVEYRLDQEDMVGPCFPYVRYQNGPFSQSVWNALDDLVAKGFIFDGSYGITDRGLVLVDLVADLAALPENRAAFELIDTTLRYCRPKTGNQLMAAAYDLEIAPLSRPTEKHKILELTEGVPLLKPGHRTLTIPEHIESLIEAELRVTPAEMVDVASRVEEIDRSVAESLIEAVTASRQERGIPSE